MDEKIQAQITLGLGVVGISAGTLTVVAPGVASKLYGFNLAESAGRDIAMRAFGIRDLALGIGILATRDQPKANKLWLQLFGLSISGDGVAALLAFRKPGANFMTFVAFVVSVVFAAAAFASSNNRK